MNIHLGTENEPANITGKSFQDLSQIRDEIESELFSLAAVLDRNNDIGMTTPLVDRDGFPRSDIDVAQGKR